MRANTGQSLRMVCRLRHKNETRTPIASTNASACILVPFGVGSVKAKALPFHRLLPASIHVKSEYQNETHATSNVFLLKSPVDRQTRRDESKGLGIKNETRTPISSTNPLRVY